MKPLSQFRFLFAFTILLVIGQINLFAQTGTAGNPFTTIGQAKTAPDGSYHFNLNGQTFQTEVWQGRVLIANDPAALSAAANLAAVTTITYTTRGILPAAALAQMKNITKITIRSSDGGSTLDASTTNSTLINRIYTNTTLHQGLNDNTLNDSWTGNGSANIAADASCVTTHGTTLDANIIHTCGNSGGTHWIPSINYRRLTDGGTNSTANFYLFVEAVDHPGGVTGANLWLKANTGATPASGTLTGWADQTGNHTMTVNGNPQIIGNAANFNPAVAFDGTDDRIQTPYSASLNTPAFTINTTFKVTGGSGYRAVISSKNASFQGYVLYVNNSNLEFWVGQGNNSWIILNGGAIPANELVQVTAKFDGTHAFLYVNGNQVATNTAVYQQQSTFTLKVGMGQGNTDENSFGFVGEIPEIVYYPSALSATDQKKVESYMAVKYGITLNPSVVNYVNSAGTSVWNNTTYWNDVFGIGKDDASSMNQTQSNSMNTGSGNGTGQSGKGNIVLSNPSSLENNDYLIIGHNNAALTQGAAGTGLPTAFSSFQRLTRTWLARHTGDVGTVSITFNMTGLTITGTTASDFRLLVDADSDGNLATGQPQVYAADSYTGGIVSFSHVALPDNRAFALVTNAPAPGAANERLWLEANTGITLSGSNVTGWSDQAGYNVFTVTGTPARIANAINFNPAISFNNTNGPATLPANRISGNSPITGTNVYAVMRSNTNTSTLLGSTVVGANIGIGMLGYQGNDNLQIGNGQNNRFKYFANVQRTNYAIVGMDIGAAPGTYTLNGAAGALTSQGGGFTDVTITPMIGGTNNNGGTTWSPFNGDVAELIVYPASLSALDKQKTETYLAVKYGIHKFGSYINNAGATIWDATANAAYHNDVFGIGRNDNSGLNQPASNSINTGTGDGTGQPTKGNILLKTPSSLDDGDFLMIGHNNAPLTETMGDLPAGLTKARLQREWKVKRTGDVGTVTMEFDFNGLPVSGGTTQLSNYILLIDVDGDGNFTTGTVTQVAPNSFGSPKIIFNGLTLPDGAVFTFVTSPGFPLPLNLLSFTAGSSNCLSNVQWKTANEVNVNRYELQVSFDNSNWSTVHTAAANNSTDVNNYAYSYNHSSRSGNKLLRLKMVDNDGKTTYSKVISVQCGKDNLFTLYPNPASTQVTLTGTKAGEQLQLIAIDGRMLQQHTATEGNSTIGIEALPSGTYLIRVLRNSRWEEAGKFVKQ